MHYRVDTRSPAQKYEATLNRVALNVQKKHQGDPAFTEAVCREMARRILAGRKH